MMSKLGTKKINFLMNYKSRGRHKRKLLEMIPIIDFVEKQKHIETWFKSQIPLLRFIIISVCLDF